MDGNIRFWLEQSRWPADAMGFIFLARAVHEIGKCMFPGVWTGSEPVTPELFNFRWPLGTNAFPLTWRAAGETERAAMYKLLLHHDRTQQRPPIKIDTRGFRHFELTEADWDVGMSIADELNAKYETARIRFTQVKSTMVNAIVSGQLQSFLRPIEGGAFEGPIKPELWNSERVGARFVWCQMNPLKPFGIAVGGDDFKYIYVAGDSLGAFVRDQFGGGRANAKRRDTAPKTISIDALGRVVQEAVKFSVERGWPPITTREWKVLFDGLARKYDREEFASALARTLKEIAPGWPRGDSAKGQSRRIDKDVRKHQLDELTAKMKSAQLRKSQAA